MRLSTRLQVALLAWFVLEAFVFSWVVHLIGGAGALLLTLIGSLFGWTLLKRAGASAMVKFRATVEGRTGAPDHRQFLDETLTVIGALGLLLPGFLSDLVGIVLAVPAARRIIARALGGGPTKTRGRSSPSTIDLDPAEWQRNEAASGASPQIIEQDESRSTYNHK